MKMLEVYGDDDFAAIEFENYFTGKSIKEIIDRFFINDEEHDGDFDMILHEFTDIDPEFIKFIRLNIQDYDFAKSHNFYFEDEILK